MDSQVHAIGKAIRPLFADPVTITIIVNTIPSEPRVLISSRRSSFDNAEMESNYTVTIML